MILVCGSFAYDTIMVFPDRFARHILPDKVHMLNVSFMVPKMRREFGGCAGNIAYNLSLLGAASLPMGTVGTDFEPYAHWMDQCGISRRHVLAIAGTYTAQAFITTDIDDNQITAFHPGAMGEAHRNRVQDAGDVDFGIVSPDGRQGMIEHASQFAAAGIPFIFDPGQGLPMFDGADLLEFMRQATYLTVNDYEGRLIEERTDKPLAELAHLVQALIVTKGANGSEIYVNGQRIEIPSAKAQSVVDPTGCGDAYRAGLLYALDRRFDWETAGRIGALMGAIKIETAGTQNHRFTMEEFRSRYHAEFGRHF
ncbi:MAG: carbohydrate kinase family protein [Acidiferrobacteraceae bacterium]